MILSKKEFMFIKMRWIIMAIIMIGLAIMTVSIKNFVVGMINTPAIQEQLKSLPKNVPFAGEIQSELQKITDFSYYSYSQWFNKTFPEVVAVLVIVLSFSVFSKEIEDKTFYILHGRVKRSEIFSAKIFWGLVASISSVFAAGIIYFLIAFILKYNMPFSQDMIWTVRALFGTVFLYSIGILFSIILKDQVKAILVDLAIFIGLYVIGIFEQTRFFGVFDYMGSAKVLNGAGIGIAQSVFFVIVSFALFELSYLKFKNMDM